MMSSRWACFANNLLFVIDGSRYFCMFSERLSHLTTQVNILVAPICEILLLHVVIYVSHPACARVWFRVSRVYAMWSSHLGIYPKKKNVVIYLVYYNICLDHSDNWLKTHVQISICIFHSLHSSVHQWQYLGIPSFRSS